MPPVSVPTVIINNKFSVRVPSKSSCSLLQKKSSCSVVRLHFRPVRSKEEATHDTRPITSFACDALGSPHASVFFQKATHGRGTSDPWGRAATAHLACRAHAWEAPPEPDGSGTARQENHHAWRPPGHQAPPSETKRPGPGAQQPRRQKRSRLRGRLAETHGPTQTQEGNEASERPPARPRLLACVRTPANI